jgi:hypothetical protein
VHIGGEGGWDYAATDEAARRIYVTHQSKIVVIDIDKNGIVAIKETFEGCGKFSDGLAWVKKISGNKCVVFDNQIRRVFD